MRDKFAGSRLPDLPNAGYSTRFQRELSDAMMFLIRGLERDRALLLEIVIKGRDLWRKRFKGEYRAIKADDEFADAIFGYLVLLAGKNPEQQLEKLQLMAKWSPYQKTGLLPGGPTDPSPSEMRDLIARVEARNRNGHA